jgi:outer membrane beta-barrel protein
MESGIRNIFLSVRRALLAMTLVVPGLVPSPAAAQDGAGGDAGEPPQVIEPRVERRDIDVAAIDTENFEVTAFVGLMSVEDFESNAVYGARLAYHVTEWLFAEASYGTTDVGTSSFEKLGGGAALLSDRTLSYYDLSLGYNLFPGEVFFGADRAFNSVFYLIGGLGSTDFAGDDQFTVNLGFGIKVLPTDYLAIRLEARDYLFDTEITGEKKTTHNLQGTLSISYFF